MRVDYNDAMRGLKAFEIKCGVSLRVILVSLLPSFQAWAHPGPGLHSFYTAFFHPILGLDHLLAALAVGFWTASISKRENSFFLPAPFAFLVGMIGGALLGQKGFAFPFYEQGISLSLAFLGVVLLSGRKMSSLTSCLLFSCFGVFHGNAHGVETAEGFLNTSTLVGLLLSTAILHLAGMVAVISIQKWLSEARAAFLIRGIGAGLVASILFI